MGRGTGTKIGVRQPIHPIKKYRLSSCQRGLLLRCLQSFRRVQRTEMAWNKITVANLLPGTSTPQVRDDRITSPDKGRIGGLTQGKNQRIDSITQDPHPYLNSQKVGKEEMEVVFFMAVTEAAAGSNCPASLFGLQFSGCFHVEESPTETGQSEVDQPVPNQT